MKTIHEARPGDAQALRHMGEALAAAPPLRMVPACRPHFDALTSMCAIAESVTFAPATIGGVPGLWCRPLEAASSSVIVYLHGGGYVLGSATGYRGLVSQLVQRSGLAAFIADYRLAPEDPFPAAFDDGLALVEELRVSATGIFLCGDSAGGGLALALAAHLAISGGDHTANAVRGAVAFSPWADLTLTAGSLEERAAADPLVSREQLAQAADQYCAPESRRDPRCNVLYADPGRMPPAQVHVGEHEVLLDDALRFEAHRPAGTVDLHVWQGMVHVFQTSIGALQAARDSLDLTAAFLRSQGR